MLLIVCSPASELARVLYLLASFLRSHAARSNNSLFGCCTVPDFQKFYNFYRNLITFFMEKSLSPGVTQDRQGTFGENLGLNLTVVSLSFTLFNRCFTFFHLL